MTLEEKAKHVSRETGLSFHLFLGHVVGEVRVECAAIKELKPSEKEVSEFEEEINWALPEEYRIFLKNFGSVYMDAKPEAWPKIDVGSIIPFWATNYGFIIFGLGKKVPKHLDLRRKFYQFKNAFPDLPFFLPLQRLVPGDQSYTGYNEDGVLCIKFAGETKLRLLDIGFNEFLVAEAKDLQDRIIKRANLGV